MIRRKEHPFKEPPCEVTFHYPDGKVKKGMVIDATRTRIHRWTTLYATRVELIQFDGVREKHIRFVYARRTEGKWRFASQTTWTFSVGITRSAIKEAEKIGLLTKQHTHSPSTLQAQVHL